MEVGLGLAGSGIVALSSLSESHSDSEYSTRAIFSLFLMSSYE